MGIDGQVCFHKIAFSQSCQTVKVHYRVCGVGNGINKGAKLLPTTVLAYPVD